MRLGQIFVVMCAVLFCGCGTIPRPSLTPTDLSAISKTVADATARVDSTSKLASELYTTGAMPQDKRLKALADDLKLLRGDLDSAKRQITSKQTEIEKLTTNMNKVVDRLNYLEPKYAASVGLVWKWRLIAIGSWVLIVAFFVFRGWLKANVPFLGGLL